jgi:hypothetical protein
MFYFDLHFVCFPHFERVLERCFRRLFVSCTFCGLSVEARRQCPGLAFQGITGLFDSLFAVALTIFTSLNSGPRDLLVSLWILLLLVLPMPPHLYSPTWACHCGWTDLVFMLSSDIPRAYIERNCICSTCPVAHLNETCSSVTFYHHFRRDITVHVYWCYSYAVEGFLPVNLTVRLLYIHHQSTCTRNMFDFSPSDSSGDKFAIQIFRTPNPAWYSLTRLRAPLLCS